jgi:hypothetical protein
VQSLDALVDSWLTFDDVAAQLGTSPNRIRNLVRDHQLAAVRRADLRQPAVPAEFVMNGDVVKGLAGTLTLLADRGFSEEEAIEWLYTADASLPGRPIDALREDRGTEVRRRAQAII